jgi:hypothetical protein
VLPRSVLLRHTEGTTISVGDRRHRRAQGQSRVCLRGPRGHTGAAQAGHWPENIPRATEPLRDTASGHGDICERIVAGTGTSGHHARTARGTRAAIGVPQERYRPVSTVTPCRRTHGAAVVTECWGKERRRTPREPGDAEADGASLCRDGTPRRPIRRSAPGVRRGARRPMTLWSELALESSSEHGWHHCIKLRLRRALRLLDAGPGSVVIEGTVPPGD